MSLINWEISLQLKWSEICILVAGTTANQVPEFKVTDTTFFVPAVSLSTQDNVKCRIWFWKNISSFKDENVWESYKLNYHSTVKIKDHNVIVNGRKFFDQTIKSG